MASRKRSRNAGQPSRFQDFVSCEDPKRNTKVLYSIVLHSNNEEHTVPLGQLENLNGLALSKKDATIDADVIWMYKGRTPYEATIVGIHTDKAKATETSLAKATETAQNVNESGSENECMEMPIRKTAKEKTKETVNYELSSGSDEEPEPPLASSTPTPSRKRSPINESSDEDEQPPKKVQSVGGLFTSADRDLLVRIEKRLERIESFLTSDKKIHTLSQPEVSLHTKPSCQPKPPTSQTHQPKPPLLDVSTNSITDQSSINYECLPGAEPAKYALNLMDSFFTDEEMKGRLFIKSQRSRSTRELLPQDKVKKILSRITERFGKEETRKEFKNITDRCNQKCRDADKKFRCEKENLLEAFGL